MAVTIPVMAKARIGHFAEVQVLKVLGGREGPRTRVERAAGAQLGRDQGLTSPHQDGVGQPTFS